LNQDSRGFARKTRSYASYSLKIH